MDVVNLLNELYNRFDQKTNDYQVYKVRLLNITPLIKFCLSSKKVVKKILNKFSLKIVLLRIGH